MSRVRSDFPEEIAILAEVSARIEVLATRAELKRLTTGELRDQIDLIVQAALHAQKTAERKRKVARC